jgi:urease accessory protein
MQCLRRCLGNIHHDPELSTQVATWRHQGILDEATVDERDAHKGRLRISTDNGQEYGLVLARGTALTAGDVFAHDTGDGAVLISLSLQELMVLTLRNGLSTEERVRWAVRVGHVLGNQHWPVAMIGEQICTPVTIDRAVMETVLKTHHVTDYCTIHYEQRSWPSEDGHYAWTTHHS